ncbi:flagellar biosynthesis protein FliR [Gluconobacter sp. DsW_056]|uniref:flagellar biosynthetic protein FliR n=1 Tax=Gluconobacter sp. DsW_056 TaxID=1511209 RepID=UPI000A3A2E92|nr:flagellar biosynthetic protein FliR [Gluconobacter sp. DsW_056]OUI82411.1 flagellar biosynthesis protein FliR [Gluconobacter sp. DsW_056]
MNTGLTDTAVPTALQGLDLSGPVLSVWALAFVLVLSRTGGVVMLMPGIGEQSMPMMVRAGCAFTLTVLLLPLVAPLLMQTHLDALAPLALCGMIAVELFAGVLIGWMARLICMALPISGQIIAVCMGISSVLQPDPDLGSGSSAPARFLNLLAPLVLLVTGAYILPIRAILGSYTIIPPGGALLLATTHAHWNLLGDSAQGVIQLTEHSFALGLELSAPFLILSLVWQGMLGIMTRLLPTLQIYNAASPLQLLGGIALLGLTLSTMIAIWQGQAFDVLRALPGL